MPPLQPVPTRHAHRGMVTAIDHLAAGAGVEILRRGGGAVDAAIATSAVLAVTSQHLCGMGGDLWAVVHPGPGQDPVALNASGRAGSGADPDRLRRAGHLFVPGVADPAAVPVPGCVDGWVALHERFGRLPFAELLEAAQRYAVDGFPASPGLVASLPQVIHLPDAADYGPAERVRPGTRVRRPGVGRALADIGRGGRDAFYQGEFGAGLIAVGAGEHTEADLAVAQAEWVTPLHADAWGQRLWTAPPNSQGYLTLAGAWIAAGLDLPDDPEDPAWPHLLIESARQAGHDRLEVLHDGADGQDLLDPSRLGPRRAAIDPGVAATLGIPGTVGDTIALCAVDADRQGVSLIQSNASGWGSGLIVPGVRIFLHNRGQGFSLQAGHPAEYGPGRRPPHTLSPALVTSIDGHHLRAVLGTMGGDSQPQILLQLLARVLHGGEGPAEAVAAGRFSLAAAPGPDGRAGDGFATWRQAGQVTVRLEGQTPHRWAEALPGLGHDVVVDPPWSSSYGHAHFIDVGPDVLTAGTDPRPLAGAAEGW